MQIKTFSIIDEKFYTCNHCRGKKMLEIIQVNHILTNTSNAEKSTIVQHENVALYHDQATQRMNKRAEKKRTSLQNTKKSDKSKVNEKKKET
jgi:hypothetical protein